MRIAMTSRASRSFALLAALCLISRAAAAGVELAPVFSDNAVLQRGVPLPVWGRAEPNAKVEVTLGDDTHSTTADADGRWRVSLKARDASKEPLVLRAAAGGAEAVARNVLVGDVWLCAGQSNMQMGLREADGGPAEVRVAANRPRLRLLTVPKGAADKPRASFDAKWKECSPESAAGFSAVGYFFGAELQATPALADVPLGLIDCSFGGTAAEAWTSAEALEGFRAEDLLPSMFGIKPAHLYNGMVAPLTSFPIRGVLWYQGESNAARPALYARLLSAMIADWRKRWDQPDLPFLIVQLPPFTDPRFAWVREAQAETSRTEPKVGLAVTIDTTDGFDPHPKQKRPVGVRLALLARRLAYGEKLVAEGPVFKSAKPDGGTVRVSFDTGGDGLAAGAGGAVKGFAVAGDDGAYRFAEASIEGDDVVVRSDAVPHPKTARYGWAGIPEATLTDRSGLPAAPFRTDALPMDAFEVQRLPAGRRVSTPNYEVEVNGDGKVTSLVVGGKQFLSNAPGAAGGTSVPGFLGPRQLQDVRALGPQLLSCGDSDVTLLLSFAERASTWELSNRGKGDVRFRVATAAKVEASGPDGGGRVTLSRGKASVTVAGVDSVADGEDGKVLEVVVKPGATKTISLDLAGKR